MKVKFRKRGDVVVTMSHEELSIMRYTLNTGVEKLAQTALYMLSMKNEEAKGASDIVDRAMGAKWALEDAVQEYLGGV